MQTIIIENGKDKVDVLYHQDIDNLKKEFSLRSKSIFVIDHKVFQNKQLKDALVGSEENIFLIKDPELNKSFKVLEKILEFFHSKKLNRNDTIFAVGGGAVTDLAAFAASIFKRGINLTLIPTSLLAQVDATIGGKTGINFHGIKNLIGSFYNPKKIIICTGFLSSLNDQEYLNGFSEIIKHSILKSSDECLNLIENSEKINSREETFLRELIERSLKIKTNVISEDFKEKGQRKFLNFGHTFAHGIEYANKENPVLHGHAVHIGMQMATEFSIQKKIISMEDYQICKDLFGLFGYDFTNIKLNAEEIFQAMKLDKKNDSDKVTLILLKSIGSPVAVEVDDENELLSFLQEFIDNFER